jgi:peptidoglycan/xylan/chitin deacetylase (PgdA/CDA1 family)
MSRLSALLAAVALLVGLAAVPASAAGARTSGAASSMRPLRVRTASLTQDGRQLVWQVVLRHTFSAASLRREHRSLCLVLERFRGGSVYGVLCLLPARGRGSARLSYMHVSVAGRGPGRVIDADISRSSAKQLTVRFLPAAIDTSYVPLRWQVLSTLRTTACAPKAPNPLGCTQLFPSRPSPLALVPQPIGCVPHGSDFVNHGPAKRREIALTFDDGPWPDTPGFLAVLEREHVPATFFQIGRQISTYGGAVDLRMLADGDMIGDHTWDHANVAAGGPFAVSEISSTASAIRKLTGFKPCLFRAPGGAVGPNLITAARGLGFATIQWDIDPRDWSRPGTAAILANVIQNSHPGAIVLQHDGGGDRSQTLAALPQEIRALRRRGYTFVTVTKLLGTRLSYK